MSSARRCFVIVLSVALGGCVLLVDPIETNDHCGIQGVGACADCIRNACEAQIDSCCSSLDCSATSILPEIDACGRGETNACADTLSLRRVTKAEEVVRACANTCKTPCTLGATGDGGARAKWSCSTAREPANECASCVYEQCGDELDSCCADSSCQDDETILNDVGACVSGDARGCAYLRQDERSTSGQAGVVRACIVDTCAEKCLGDGLTHTSCTLLNGGKFCSCSNSEVAGSQICTAETSDGYCVVGKDGCTCGEYSCSAASTGCSCVFNGENEGTLCRAPFASSSSGAADGVCCVRLQDRDVTCSCRGFSSCTEALDEYQVTSCDLEDVLTLLRPSGRVVTVCSR